MNRTVSIQEYIATLAEQARKACVPLRGLSSAVKDQALKDMAQALQDRSQEIFAANAADIEAAATRGLSGPLLERLKLSQKKLDQMAQGCLAVAALPDPVGRIISGETRPNGLKIEQVRVPLGVIAVIFESRPNVTVDAAILAVKTGNAIILRGGSEALKTNTTLAKVISEAGTAAGMPEHSIQFVESTDRAANALLATQNGLIDLIVPRGGEGLKKALSAVATIPVVYAAGGTCHVYVDAQADVEMAIDIIVNSKTNNPSVCNAAETLLVHQDIAESFLPRAAAKLQSLGVELRGDAQAAELVTGINPATEEDWSAEYLELILAVKVVESLSEAVDHITRHGSAHSEAIVTSSVVSAERFLAEVDAAAVYVNASTRFTDGYEFGMGAEVGISTQKLHVRGPMGLESLTTTKYLVRGSGQVR